jgi:hypothetical protein
MQTTEIKNNGLLTIKITKQTMNIKQFAIKFGTTVRLNWHIVIIAVFNIKKLLL